MDLDLVEEEAGIEEKPKTAEVAEKCSETEIKIPEIIQIEVKKAECKSFKPDIEEPPKVEENVPAEDAVNEGEEKRLQAENSKNKEVEIDLHKSIESILSESEDGEDAAHPIEDDDEEEEVSTEKFISRNA